MTKTNSDIQTVVKSNKDVYSASRRMDIALQIKHYMLECGIRNIDLAQRLGVSEANVSKLLKGNQNLSLDTIYMLTDAIEQPLSVIVGRMDSLNTNCENPETWTKIMDESFTGMDHNIEYGYISEELAYFGDSNLSNIVSIRDWRLSKTAIMSTLLEPGASGLDTFRTSYDDAQVACHAEAA